MPSLPKHYCRRSKKTTYTENFVGELIFKNSSYFVADLSLIRMNNSEVCNFLCTEHGPTESHIWFSGDLIFRKTRNRITSVTARRTTIAAKIITKMPSHKNWELFKARPVQFGALPAAAGQLFTEPRSQPKIEPNFGALSWFFLKEKPQNSCEPGGLVNSFQKHRKFSKPLCWERTWL